MKKKLVEWAAVASTLLTPVAGTGFTSRADAGTPPRQDTYGQPTIRTVYDTDVARLEEEKKACDAQGVSVQRTANGALTGILGALGNRSNPIEGGLRGAADQTYQDSQREQAAATRCRQNAVDLNDMRNRQATARQEAANNRAAELGIERQYPNGESLVVPTASEDNRSPVACAEVYSNTYKAIINSRNPNVNYAIREAERAENICRSNHR